jgi:alpha-1,6-mannosyltransferase
MLKDEPRIKRATGTPEPNTRDSRISTDRPRAALGAVAVISEVLYLLLVRLDAVNGVRPVLTFLALMFVLFGLYAAAYFSIRNTRGSQRGALVVIAAGALLFRVTLLPAGLPPEVTGSGLKGMFTALRADVRGAAVSYDRFQLFDDDVWRYLWDGHVWAHGVNPFLYAPTHPALDGMADDENRSGTDGRAVWGDIRDNINYASTPTIYPPLAQAVFRAAHALAPGSVLVMKTLLVGFDLLAALLIALALRTLGRPPELAILYAWNPLVIKVFAGSGHMDAILAAALAATAYFVARQAPRRAGVSFGLAVLTKICPVVLLPFLLKRIGWRNTAISCAVVLVGYLPFLGAGRRMFGGLMAFTRDWQFNAGPYTLLCWLAGVFSQHPVMLARLASAILIITAVAWLAWVDDGHAESFAACGAAALGAVIVLGPAAMPWYVVWLLPLAILSGQQVWIHFSALVCIAFLVMIDQQEHTWALGLEYTTLAPLLWLAWRHPWPGRRTVHAKGKAKLFSNFAALRFFRGEESPT